MAIIFMPCKCVPGMECNVNGRCPVKDRNRMVLPDDREKLRREAHAVNPNLCGSDCGCQPVTR